jgi:hypothetical protein
VFTTSASTSNDGSTGFSSGPDGGDAGPDVLTNAAPADAADNPCATSADCPAGLACGFSVAEGCAATRGLCFPTSDAGACAPHPVCTCAGATDLTPGCGLLGFEATSTDYAREPVAYQGDCATPDAPSD